MTFNIQYKKKLFLMQILSNFKKAQSENKKKTFLL